MISNLSQLNPKQLESELSCFDELIGRQIETDLDKKLILGLFNQNESTVDANVKGDGTDRGPNTLGNGSTIKHDFEAHSHHASYSQVQILGAITKL